MLEIPTPNYDRPQRFLIFFSLTYSQTVEHFPNGRRVAFRPSLIIVEKYASWGHLWKPRLIMLHSTRVNIKAATNYIVDPGIAVSLPDTFLLGQGGGVFPAGVRLDSPSRGDTNWLSTRSSRFVDQR